jgi:hypothetical protein
VAGILFTLGFQTLLRFLQLPWARIPWSLVVFVSAMCALGALGFAGNARFSQMTFIDQRDFPGGPNEVVVQLYSNWANVMAFVS